jgi:hypothetical protein
LPLVQAVSVSSSAFSLVMRREPMCLTFVAVPKIKPPRSPAPDTAEETARILFLTYGHDAVEMAVLRCAELKEKGDKSGLSSWKKVLRGVRRLAAVNPEERGTIN